MNTIFNRFNDKNIAPYLAKMIIVKDSNNNIVGKIPINNYKPKYGERLYRFAVLSDIHFNETETIEDSNNLTTKDDAILDFKRAINFISTKPENDKDNIEFGCICGDIMCGTGWIGDKDTDDAKALNDYKTERLNSNKDIYTCTGNHDTNDIYDWDDGECYIKRPYWNECTGMSEDRKDYFSKEHITSDGKTIKDNFYFLSMRKFSLGTQGDMFKDEDIDELENYLELHKNERTFIFTHAPFPYRSGVFGHSYNNGGYWLGGKWLKRLSDLSYKYKNTLWFSGHSHYEWMCQGILKETITPDSTIGTVYNWKENNYDANIWPANQDHEREVGWALHIPSCSGVRPVGNGTGSTEYGPTYWKIYNTSEFAIIDVYENYIDFRGVSLVGQDRNENSGNLYYNPIAQYRLNTTIKDETTKSYDLKILSLDDINNMSINEDKIICITSVSYNNLHLGHIKKEFKSAAINNSFKTSGSSLYNSDEAKCSSDVNCDLNSENVELTDAYKMHYNNECQLSAEMRDLVNNRYNQFSFILRKDENGYCILNSENLYININDDNSLKWSNNSCYFEIENNPNTYTSSSCLVSQTNNKNLLRLKIKDTNNYIMINSTPSITPNDSGWTYIYIYEIIRA